MGLRVGVGVSVRVNLRLVMSRVNTRCSPVRVDVPPEGSNPGPLGGPRVGRRGGKVGSRGGGGAPGPPSSPAGAGQSPARGLGGQSPPTQLPLLPIASAVYETIYLFTKSNSTFVSKFICLVSIFVSCSYMETVIYDICHSSSGSCVEVYHDRPFKDLDEFV